MQATTNLVITFQTGTAHVLSQLHVGFPDFDFSAVDCIDAPELIPMGCNGSKHISREFNLEGIPF